MIRLALSWKLAWFKCFVGAFVIMATTVDASLVEADIVSAHTAKVIIFIISTLIVGFKSVDMFVDQTINNIKRNGDPLGLLSGDTTQITRQQVQQVTETTVTK